MPKYFGPLKTNLKIEDASNEPDLQKIGSPCERIFASHMINHMKTLISSNMSYVLKPSFCTVKKYFILHLPCLL